MSTGWNIGNVTLPSHIIINLLGNEYWLEHVGKYTVRCKNYKPTGK